MKAIENFIDFIFFKYYSIREKVKKLIDFWKLYRKWCIEFDKKFREELKLK